MLIEVALLYEEEWLPAGAKATARAWIPITWAVMRLDPDGASMSSAEALR